MFCTRPLRRRVALDGLVGDDGLVEIKLSRDATHIENLLTETVATIHRRMQAQMAHGRA